MNAKHRNDAVATDTVHCHATVAGEGYKCVQMFVDAKTMATNVCGINSDNQFFNSLENNIQKRGAIGN